MHVYLYDIQWCLQFLTFSVSEYSLILSTATMLVSTSEVILTNQLSVCVI